MVSVAHTSETLSELDSLHKKLRQLQTCESNLMKAPKELTLNLACDESGAVTSCVITGGLGTIHVKSCENFGLPSDDYKLTVRVSGVEKVKVIESGEWGIGHPKHGTISGSIEIPFTKQHKSLEIDTGKKMTVGVFEIDGSTCWLGKIDSHVNNVRDHIDRVLYSKRVPLAAHDDAPTVSWLTFEGTMNNVLNKMARLESVRERINGRYLAGVDDGWYEMFGDSVAVDQSSMRVCMDSDYRMNDIALGINAARELDKCIASSRNVRLASDMVDIVEGLCAGDNNLDQRDASRHLAVLKELVAMRGELTDALKERRNGAWVTRSGVWNEREEWNVVENRAKFLTLAAVDAGLRHRVATLCDVSERANALRDVKLCMFQLRQIYANNERNERKLSEASFLASQTQMQRVQVLCGSTKSVATPVPSNLGRRLCMTRVLEALARVHENAPDISLDSNYMYASKSVLGGEVLEHDVQGVFVRMVNADKQNRVITPLIHSHIMALVHGAVQDRELWTKRVVGLYDTDIQPMVRMALTGEWVASPYAFLDHTKVRTGYIDAMKTNMLVQLMFTGK